MKTILFVIAGWIALFALLYRFFSVAQKRALAKECTPTEPTPEEIARAELLAELQEGYRAARKKGKRGGVYLCAVSHCIQLLQAGCEIDAGAARMALRGLEGDEDVMRRVGSILYPGERE